MRYYSQELMWFIMENGDSKTCSLNVEPITYDAYMLHEWTYKTGI